MFNVSSLSTREGIDGSSNAQEEMVIRQVWEKSEFVTRGPSKLAKQPNNHKTVAHIINPGKITRFVHATDLAWHGLHFFRSQMLFKGCGVGIHLCKQCDRVPPLHTQEFTDKLRHRLRTVWRDVEGLNPQDTNSKLATYQSLFAVPFDLNCAPLHCFRCVETQMMFVL